MLNLLFWVLNLFGYIISLLYLLMLIISALDLEQLCGSMIFNHDPPLCVGCKVMILLKLSFFNIDLLVIIVTVS